MYSFNDYKLIFINLYL